MRLFKKLISSFSLLLLTPMVALAQATGGALPPIQDIPSNMNDIAQGLATYDIFTPSLGDKSIGFLGEIFGNVGNVLYGNSGQLLAELFKVFNSGMVIVASAILVYTVVMSVINTAQEGEFMGKKANSAWVIFRAVTGISILVPKFGGYCLVQVFIMWVTVQGVGLADKTWARAIDYLQAGGVIHAQSGSTINAGLLPVLNRNASVLNSAVCMYKLEDLARKEREDAIQQLKANPTNVVLQAKANQPLPQYNPSWTIKDNIAGRGDPTLSFGYPSNNPETQTVCGQYSWFTTTHFTKNQRETDNGRYLAINEEYSKAMKSGMEAVVATILPAAKTVAQASNQALTSSGKTALNKTVQEALVNSTFDYVNIMQPAMQKGRILSQTSITNSLDAAKHKGWILAGAYYWDIAKAGENSGFRDYQFFQEKNYNVNIIKADLGANFGDAVSASMEQTLGGSYYVNAAINLSMQNDNNLSPAYILGLASLLEARESPDRLVREDAYRQIGQFQNKGVDGFPAISPSLKATVDARIPAVFSGSENDLFDKMSDAPEEALGELMLGPAFAAAYEGMLWGGKQIWNEWYGIMNAPGDPIAMVQTLGKKMVDISTSMWIGGTAAFFTMSLLSSIGSALTGIGYAVIAATKMFTPVVMSFLGVTFVTGLTMAVYIPMIPFMIFSFAAIGWLISVVESMVAAPLVAAAITHPEGHDLLGKAEQFGMLLMGVLLRPVVMIIGFFSAVILTRVSLRLVNAGFSHAVESAGLMGTNATGALAFLSKGSGMFMTGALMIVYTMIVISLINLVFNAGIVKLWETIWMWVGFHQPSTSVDQAMQEVKGGVHSGAQALGDAGGGMARGSIDDHISGTEKDIAGQQAKADRSIQKKEDKADDVAKKAKHAKVR